MANFRRCAVANHRVIAASGGKGILSKTLTLTVTQKAGYVADRDKMIGYALTPGYETYRGLGWYGVIVQDVPSGKQGV